MHYDLAKPALLAGKDVFLEWPLASNLLQAEELIAIAKSKGSRVIVGLQERKESTIAASQGNCRVWTPR